MYNVYIYMYIHMYVYINLYVYIYIYLLYIHIFFDLYSIYTVRNSTSSEVGIHTGSHSYLGHIVIDINFISLSCAVVKVKMY